MGVLSNMGDTAKAITGIVVLCSLVVSGVGYVTLRGVAEAKVLIAENTKEDKEFRARLNISQISKQIWSIQDRYGTSDPLQIPEADRDEYRRLLDDLEFYQGVLDEIKKQSGG